MRKATQEAEQPQKLVVQVPWKVKSIRKSRIKLHIQRVLRNKRNQKTQKFNVRPGLEEGPGAKKTLMNYSSHTFRYQPQEGASSILSRKEHLTATLLQEHP